MATCCLASRSCSRRSFSRRVISLLAASSRAALFAPDGAIANGDDDLSVIGWWSSVTGVHTRGAGLLVRTDDAGEPDRCLDRDRELERDRSRSFTFESKQLQ